MVLRGNMVLDPDIRNQNRAFGIIQISDCEYRIHGNAISFQVEHLCCGDADRIARELAPVVESAALGVYAEDGPDAFDDRYILTHGKVVHKQTYCAAMKSEAEAD